MTGKIIFSKYSNRRKEKYRIVTSIYKDNLGKKWVEKRPIDVKAQQHIEKIYDNYKKLSEHNENSDIRFNVCKQKQGNIEFEYITGKIFSQVLTDILLQDDYVGFVEKVKEYSKWVKGLTKLSKFEMTNEFKRFFGNVVFSHELKSLQLTNIDCTFDNLIVNDVINIIDYEWVFDFPIPINFVIYRAVRVYLTKENLGEEISLRDLCRLLEISTEEIQQYDIMERNFQAYVNQEVSTVIKQPVKMQELIECFRAQEQIYSVQIFKDYGEGYTEQNSIRVNAEKIEPTQYKVAIQIEEDIKYIRLDPIEGYCIMQVKSVVFTKKEEHELIEYTTNGTSIEGNLVFLNGDPQIILKIKPQYKSGIIEIIFEIEEFNINMLKLIQDMNMQYQRILYDNRMLEETKNTITHELETEHTTNDILQQRLERDEKKIIQVEDEIQDKLYENDHLKEVIQVNNNELKKKQDELLELYGKLTYSNDELRKNQENLECVKEQLSSTNEILNRIQDEFNENKKSLIITQDELALIKNSRAWKFICRLKNTSVYKIIMKNKG